MTTSPITPVRLHERVSDAIRQQIIRGDLKTGDRLPTENEIARTYGVSRNVVREAVRSLAKEGLLNVRQGSGTYVKDGIAQAFSEFFGLAVSVGSGSQVFADIADIREIVEPGVAALAAQRARDEDIVRLRAEVEKMEVAIEDEEVFIMADHSFHLAIARATHNPFAEKLLEPIVGVLFAQRSKAFYVLNSPKNAQEFHRQLLAAIEDRDAPTASRVMQNHLRRVRYELEILKQHQRAAEEPKK